jgi:hypothetical protein
VRTLAFLPALCLLALQPGCGGTLDKPVEPAEAAEVLNASLEAWKQGESHGALRQRQPPVYFNEPEWESGKKLVKFEAGPVTLTGRQGRCSVKLTLQDKSGKVTERVIGYQIDTTPTVVITREALGP